MLNVLQYINIEISARDRKAIKLFGKKYRYLNDSQKEIIQDELKRCSL